MGPEGACPRGLYVLGGVSEVLPTVLGVEHAQVHELPCGAVIAALGARARIAGPDPFTRRVHVTKQRPARHVHSFETTPGTGVHGGDLVLPPFPHLPFGVIPACSIQEETSNPNNSRGPVTEVLFRPSPPVSMLNNQSVRAETAKDCSGLPGAYSEQTSGRIDREGGVLGQEGIDLAGKVTEAGTGEEVVTAVGEFAFQRGHQRRSQGWTRIAAAQAGLLPYWARLAGWTTEDGKKPFRPLRKDVYDLLDEQGLIVKPPGQGAPLDISPAAVVASDIADRVLDLVERISNETGIVAADYRGVAVAAAPTEALRQVVGSSTTTVTTSELSSIGRLDLSLEQALLAWKDLAIDPIVLTTARERLDYWMST